MQIGNIELKWLGHAGFFISNKKNIYIDPYKIPFDFRGEKADIILITHSHYDHCSIEDLGKIVKDNCVVVMPADCQSKLTKLDNKIKFQNLETGQEVSAGGVVVKAVPAYNINKSFHAKDECWNGYVLEINGVKIYHAGDTDLIPEMSQLGKIDVALLPVGGTYTMNSDEAAKAAMIIKPKIAVPMHFGEVVGSNEDALRFKELCENEGINAEVLEK